MGARCWTCELFLVLLNLSAGAASVGWEYAVIIDAGSTGSRVHVYRYYTQSSYNSPWAAVELPEAVHKTTPGLASYAFDPKTAANSLQPLLKFAKDKVPADQWHTTPIQLMATAGLRMLNNGSADAIMVEVRGLLAVSDFDYRDADGARVLSGTEEGLWGWVATNYATGALQAATMRDTPSASQLLLGRKDMPRSSSSSSRPAPAAPMQGVLELGGASMQVTFMPKERLPGGQAADLVLPSPLGADRVYSRSFDGLGLQAAMAGWDGALAAGSKKKDPCLPAGYKAPGSSIAGSSDWGACRAGVKALLPLNGTCLYKHCGISGTFLPPTDGALFLGLDNFYYTARMLGLPPDSRISLQSLEKAAKKLCARSWHDVREEYLKHGSTKDPYILKVCFSSALIISILKDGLHIDPAAPVLTASNSVPTPKGGTVEVNWALGALIVEVLQLGGVALRKGHDHISLAPPGSGQGASDATAAAVAASFCLLMLVLSSCASYFRVGMMAPAAAARTSIAASGGGAAAGGLPGKYQRMRAVSPNMYTNGERSPGSAPGNVIEVAAYFQDRRSAGGVSSQTARQR